MTVLKVEESLHELSMENNDFQDGWVLAYLSDVGNARLGKTPRKSNYRDEGIHRIVKFRDVTDKGVAYSESKAAYVVDNPSALKVLRPLSIGDVLVTASAHSGDQIGKKCAYVESLPEIKGGVYFVGELLGITSDPRIMHSKWPYYWFLSKDGFKAVQAAVAGVHLTNGRAQNIPIPIAPVDEQNRIIQKLDELLYSLNATKDRLTKVSIILKRFRQAVLAAACSGRLTADWRENQSHIQHAKDLLSSILAERRELLEESHLRKRKTSNFRYPYEEPMRTDPSEFGEIPDGWIWALGADLFTWSSGDFLPKKKQEKGPYPIYGGNGIIGFHSGYLIDHPTLVIGRVGALCGNVYITSGKAWVTDNAIYAAHVPKYLNLQYIQMVFSQSNLNTNAGGSGQPFVNQTALNKVVVPLPPLAEQHEIVRRVDAMFKLADAVEKRVAVATARAEKLTQAILAKVFRGELVPTEAELARREGRSYEPASDLLARIKSERESKGASKLTPRNRNQQKARRTRPAQ